MKYLKLTLLAILISSLNSAIAQDNTEQTTSFPPIEDRYLGQKTPDLTPELFAPGLVSTEGKVEGYYVFTPDMNAFYFNRHEGEFKQRTSHILEYKKGKWTKVSKLPADIRNYREHYDPHYQEFKNLELFKNFRGFSLSSKGTYFLYDMERDGSGSMYYSRLINGKYESPKKMNEEINSGLYKAHPFVAPDESYLMWDAEKEGEHGADIYISFRQEDGSWGAPINMGAQINTGGYEQGAKLSPDGKYLFFWRGDEKLKEDGGTYWEGSPYWVDAQIIETLRPSQKPNFPALTARYFGEKRPGLTPKLFAPDILSPDGLFEGGSFSPDMRRFYFTRKNGKYKERTFFVIHYENNKWGNESETDLKYPRFSRDGNIIYKGNKYRERTESGWSDLKSMGAPFTDKHIMGISVSDQGTFFFDQFERPDTVGAISYSRYINGKYEPRQKMGKEINTGTWIAHPTISPDESYLIWDVEREDGYGGSDIYISFRQKDGSWLPAINMGDKINTAFQESGAGISPDGEYLFFSRGEWKTRDDGSTYWFGRPYWIDAQVIENLRPTSTSYEIAYSSVESGNGEIYLTDAKGKSKTKVTDYEGGDGYPAWSPDGKRIAFYAKYDDKKTWSIHTMNRDGSNRKRLTHQKNTWDSAPAWSPDGKKLAFGRAYKGADGNWKNEIWLMNADGSDQMQIGKIVGGAPHFLLDGRIVFHSESETSEICIANIDGSNIIKLTNNNAKSWHPEVSPDGKQIAFMSNRDGNHEIYIMDIDGANQTRLTHNNVRDSTPSWSFDGSQLIFVSRDVENNAHIFIMNKDGSSMKRLISDGGQPAWFKSYK